MLSHEEHAHLISFEYMLKFGDKFINSCILMNGGAIIATLSLIGRIFNKLQTSSFIWIGYGLIFFILGLLAAVISFGLAHKAQEKVTFADSAKIKQIKCEQAWKKLTKTEECFEYIKSLQNNQDKYWKKFKFWKSLLVSFLIVSLIFFVVGTGYSYAALFLQNKAIDYKITQKLCTVKPKSSICR